MVLYLTCRCLRSSGPTRGEIKGTRLKGQEGVGDYKKGVWDMEEEQGQEVGQESYRSSFSLSRSN